MKEFVAIDWGSSNVRSYKIVNGECTDRRDFCQGIIHNQDYLEVYESMTEGWDGPVLMSGMVGSANGWRETGYVSSLDEIPNHLVDVSDLVGRQGWLIPGLSHHHTFLDVMRGEETQLFGINWNGLIIMPGTHSKWAWMLRDELLQFHTQMTGELFALLQERGLISTLLVQDSTIEFQLEDFMEGVQASQGMGGMLHHLFSVRSRGVTQQKEGLRDYLSGLLIGSELMSQEVSQSTLIIGKKDLFDRYKYACSLLYPQVNVHFEDEESATLRGMKKIWKVIS